MDSRKRNANGTFQKGQPPPVEAHRKNGVRNKITRDIRQGCIDGFARHGSNGRGEGGFAGYIFFLAKRHPKAACRVIEKLLPLQVNGSGLGNAVIGTINVQSIPSGSFLSSEDIRKIQQPQLLEHEPIDREAAPEFVEDAESDEVPEVVEPIEVEDTSVETGRQIVKAARHR